MRPDVGAPLRRCALCSCWEHAGAPDCPRCRDLVDALIEAPWRDFCREYAGIGEVDLAGIVAEEVERHDWRVVDAAFDRLVCPQCHGRLSRGPSGCQPCDLADGNRYAAIEVDRPGVPPGNEHAIRVNVAVVRRPHHVSKAELLGRRSLLPALLVGALPTRAEAQRMGAQLKGGLTYADLDPVVADLASRAARG